MQKIAEALAVGAAEQAPRRRRDAVRRLPAVVLAHRGEEGRRLQKPGDRVVTTSGIYGSVTKINEKSVKLQIADKVTIEVAKAAIGGYQGQDPVVPESGNL